MDFILQKFRKSNDDYECWHTYKNGAAKYPAFLDDYAYLIQACIQLQEITSHPGYLYTAKAITTYSIKNFADEISGYFFFTHKDQQDIVLRKKEVYDGAVPSGNSVMAENLIYLSVIFDNSSWQRLADEMLQTLAKGIIGHPTSFGIWASLLQKYAFGINEVVICGPEFITKRNVLLQQYLPGKILQATLTENRNFPMLNGKKPGKETLIFLCRQYSCKEPVNSIEKLIGQIEAQGKV